MTTRRKFLGESGILVGGAAAFGAAYAESKVNKEMSDILAYKSAGELATLVASREVSATELTDYFIARIEQYDGALNAVVVRDFDRAREAARAMDSSGGQGGALKGVPMTVKESYDVAGLKTTWGFPPWKDMVREQDSDVVAALRGAGAVILGKTNVPLMLGDYQSYNDIYGQTNNPWDTALGPGGSSGGSAAALAAGLTGLEAGSDIGGSIRNPAHYCGVYGHKPTWNIVPMTGHAPPVAGVSSSVDLAVVGPLARSVDDLELSLRLYAGAHELLAPGWKLDLPEPRARRLKDLRVAFWHTDPSAPVDVEIQAKSRKVLDVLNRAGATVSETARPEVDLARGGFTYMNLMQAVNSSGVPPEVFAQNMKIAEGFADDDMSIDALFARASIQSHNDWANFNRHRVEVRYAWKRFFDDWDVLVCPISATTAFAHDHRPFGERTLQINGEPRPYFEQSFWAGLTTLPGLPSTVFPTGAGKDGLPIGLQAVSAEFGDYTCIEFARLMEQELGGFVAPAGYS